MVCCQQQSQLITKIQINDKLYSDHVLRYWELNFTTEYCFFGLVLTEFGPSGSQFPYDYQISQNFQTFLQHNFWRNKHKSHLVIFITSFLHIKKGFWLIWRRFEVIFVKISQNFIKSHLKICLISQISVHSLWHVCLGPNLVNLSFCSLCIWSKKSSSSSDIVQTPQQGVSSYWLRVSGIRHGCNWRTLVQFVYKHFACYILTLKTSIRNWWHVLLQTSHLSKEVPVWLLYRFQYHHLLRWRLFPWKDLVEKRCSLCLQQPFWSHVTNSGMHLITIPEEFRDNSAHSKLGT